ncbi:MAG: DUF2149 domain-containing protein [Clostridiales bacterium]|jgi:hypothetical protein|nr:DUF2149 domain-containing protein [Clostridiales bacterium]
MLRHHLKQRLSQAEDIDPTSGLANMLDVMLVFCCGLMVALVLSWNLQSVLFSDVSPQEKERLLEAIRNAIEVQQARELDEVPDFLDSGGGGSGFLEMGTVYQDPETGKLILIQSQ